MPRDGYGDADAAGKAAGARGGWDAGGGWGGGPVADVSTECKRRSSAGAASSSCCRFTPDGRLGVGTRFADGECAEVASARSTAIGDGADGTVAERDTELAGLGSGFSEVARCTEVAARAGSCEALPEDADSIIAEEPLARASDGTEVAGWPLDESAAPRGGFRPFPMTRVNPGGGSARVCCSRREDRQFRNHCSELGPPSGAGTMTLDMHALVEYMVIAGGY